MLVKLLNCFLILNLIVFVDGIDKKMYRANYNRLNNKIIIGKNVWTRNLWPFERKSVVDHSLNSTQHVLMENLKEDEKRFYFLQEYNFIHERVLKFEAKLFVPIKRPLNSRMIYADEIQGITVMTIGDHKCDTNYGEDLKVVVLVPSRVEGFVRRETIRQTWGQQIKNRNDSKLYFVIGSAKDQSIQKKIESENEKFGDILQYNFIDNYYNLTIKSLGILRWITLNCFKTKFIYKVDDDSFLNHENLLNFLDRALENTIYGYLFEDMKPHRSPGDIWFVSKSDYADNFYPDFIAGPWLMSGSLVPIFYEVAITETLPAIFMEDVYINGILASKLGVNREHLNGTVRYVKAVSNTFNYCLFNKSIMFWGGLDDSSLKNGWNKVLNSRNISCDHSTALPFF